MGPPSGIVEPFEPPARAMLREIREETGVTVSVDALVALDTSDLITYPNGDRAVYTQLIFSCTYLSGSAGVSDDENDAIGWFAAAALPPLSAAWRRRIDYAFTPSGRTWFGR